MEGLEGVRSEAFDRQEIEKTLAGLGKRRFLLHNVHEDAAVVFNTRWTMSYLAGPLTRDQISSLSSVARQQSASTATAQPTPINSYAASAAEAPVLAPGIQQVTCRPKEATWSIHSRHYRATLPSDPRQTWTSTGRSWLRLRSARVLCRPTGTNPSCFAPPDSLLDAPEPGVHYAECPSAAAAEKNYREWEKSLLQWLRKTQLVRSYRSNRYRMSSERGETEGEFRVRLQQIASEKRDEAVSDLRNVTAVKHTRNRLLRAEQAIAREQQQSTKLDTAVSWHRGVALLGSASRVRRRAGIHHPYRRRHKRGERRRGAKETRRRFVSIPALNAELESESIRWEPFDAQSKRLRKCLSNRTTDIHISFVGLA
jgi:hypothetical protein